MTAAPNVVVLDYGFGNVRSAVRALERVGARVELTADRARAQAADGLVVPGVGAFAAVMEGLRAVRAPEVVDRRLAGGRAVLGICVGMQVMFDAGDEHGVHTDGLGEWPGLVDRLPAATVPHMGWNTVRPPAGSTLFAGIETERFYFVHSYAARSFPLSGSFLPDDGASPPSASSPSSASRPFRAPLVTWADHGGLFVAAVENGPLAATQFHPEKSGDAGARLLSNWLKTL